MLYYYPDREIYDEKTGWCTIPNELLTQRERDIRFPSVPDKAFLKVLVSKKKTTIYMGKRVPYTGAKLVFIKTI